MKTLFFLVIACLAMQMPCAAQSKITRYAVVSIHPRNGFTTKLVADLQSGKQPEYFSFRDSTVTSNLQKVTGMETIADVLNYMSAIGWTFTGSTGLPSGFMLYYFKRDFDPAEIASHSVQAGPLVAAH